MSKIIQDLEDLEYTEEQKQEQDYEIEQLYSENENLREELEEVKEELECSEIHLNKKLRDIKFGTNLQSDIVKVILKFAEDYGVRFEVLDIPETAENITKDLGHNIELANQIGDVLVSYFED